MFPVFRRPRGSRNESLETSLPSLTLYKLRASASEPVLLVANPLAWFDAPFLVGSEPFEVGGAMVRTRSAQDFGAALTGGAAAPAGDPEVAVASAASVWDALPTAAARWSPLDGRGTFTASEAILVEGCLDWRVVAGMFGMAGMMGRRLVDVGRPEALTFGVVC